MDDDDEQPTWPGHELVEKVVGMHERVLRNLCLAANAAPDAAPGSSREWHLGEAEEMADSYIEYHRQLEVWLAERGVVLPSPQQQEIK